MVFLANQTIGATVNKGSRNISEGLFGALQLDRPLPVFDPQVKIGLSWSPQHVFSILHQLHLMISEVFSHLIDSMMEASSKLSLEISFYSGSLPALSEGVGFFSPPHSLFIRHSQLCCSSTFQQGEQQEGSISLPSCVCSGICSTAAHISNCSSIPDGQLALLHTTSLRDGPPHPAPELLAQSIEI